MITLNRVCGCSSPKGGLPSLVERLWARSRAKKCVAGGFVAQRRAPEVGVRQVVQS